MSNDKSHNINDPNRKNSLNSWSEYPYFNSENFWSVDPLILGDNTKYLSDDNLTKENSEVNNLSDNAAHNPQFYNSKDENTSANLTMGKDFSRKSPKKMVNQRILRKLPIHFIDSKDWQLYLEYATTRNGCTNQNTKFKMKNNKLYRLLNSFYNLYTEYANLNEQYELLRKQIFDNSQNNSLSSDDNIKSTSKLISMAVKDFSDSTNQIADKNSEEKSCQTDSHIEWSDLNNDQLNDVLSYSETPPFSGTNNNTSKRWNLGLNISTRRNSMSGSSENSFSMNKSKKSKTYDKLVRKNFLGQQCIDIIEEVQNNRAFITHKMSLMNNLSTDDVSQNELINSSFLFNSIASALRCATTKSSLPSSPSGNISLINVPIIMDMMLPKIQSKIQYVFDECPFLNNALEIVAELRQLNYNKQSTVEYFKFTKQLRGYIKEFINNGIDSRSRMIILRCLYRDDIPNSMNFDENDSVLKLKTSKAHCKNCGCEFEYNFEELNDGIEDKTEIESNKGLRKNKRTHSLDTTELVFNDKMLSKFTDIEPGIFDNVIQDSFTQTVEITTVISNNKNGIDIKSFGQSVYKNVVQLKKSIRETKLQVGQLRRQVSSLLKALKNNIELIMNLSSKHFISDEHKNRILLLARQVEELKLKLKDEETKRRLVYNLMQEQMGNVRVYCRCRDIPHNENILEINPDFESIVLPILPQERFDFDKVFPSNMSQKDIYEEFRPLVMSFIDGFNVCFITYGSEASGKTFTLIGGLTNQNANSSMGTCMNTDENGIMQRALNTLLVEQRLRSRDWDYKIAACLVEIYNDNCIDLLSGETGIQLYVDCGMESVYQKLKSVPIMNESDAEVLVQLCRVKRKVARTALNPASSRSHLITLIRLQGRSKIHGENIRSFMCLCDLAGFEDIIKAETQSNKTLSKEAGYINRSLTAFNRVFVSLRRQDPNTVCYRDTKLTHLLKPFLTNSGKCALIITVRTDRRSLSSTQNTLRFGRETRGVSLGKARRQVNN